MRISDLSSDVCSSDLFPADRAAMFASTELCGMLASILFIGKLLNSKHRKTILVFAMVAIIVGNFASVFVYKSNVLLLARLLAGIGEGVAVAALGDRKSTRLNSSH